MTLRDMFPEWWCKIIFSVSENCSGDYNWLDFSIYEFIFSVVVVFIIKWIINCLLFILGVINQDNKMDSTIISPSLLGKDLDIPNYEMEDIKGRDLEFDNKGRMVFGFVNEGKLTEEILKGGVVSGGGSEAALDVIRAMTRGNNLRVGELSNMTNWLGQYKDGVEFGLKRKMKVGGKVVSIVQIKVTGKDKFTIAYLDWDNGKRPLLTRKIKKNVSAKNLPKELKKSVKVG